MSKDRSGCSRSEHGEQYIAHDAHGASIVSSGVSFVYIDSADFHFVGTSYSTHITTLIVTFSILDTVYKTTTYLDLFSNY